MAGGWFDVTRRMSMVWNAVKDSTLQSPVVQAVGHVFSRPLSPNLEPTTAEEELTTEEWKLFSCTADWMLSGAPSVVSNHLGREALRRKLQGEHLRAPREATTTTTNPTEKRSSAAAEPPAVSGASEPTRRDSTVDAALSPSEN